MVAETILILVGIIQVAAIGLGTWMLKTLATLTVDVGVLSSCVATLKKDIDALDDHGAVRQHLVDIDRRLEHLEER